MNKKFAGGCCGIIALAIVAVIVFGLFNVRHAVQRSKSWIGAQIDDAKHRSAVESAWQPPTAKPDALWFPAAVDRWTLSISEDIAAVPDLQLDRAGRRGKYRGEKQDIEVIVVPVSGPELDDIFNRAPSLLAESSKRVIAGNSANGSYKIAVSSSQISTRTPGRLSVQINGDEHSRLWWIKDWLFIFRTTGPEDPDAFADRFIETMSAPAAELEKR